MRGARSSGAHFLFWLSFASFALAAVSLLFFSEALFLGDAGAKASLMAEARKWRGAPPGAITKSVGEALGRYLSASKHVSRAAVRVSEATPARLSIEVRLPWAEVSARKRRQRAELACRLGGAMLESAGARGARLLVRLRRMRKDSTASDPAGVAAYSSDDGKCVWRERLSRRRRPRFRREKAARRRAFSARPRRASNGEDRLMALETVAIVSPGDMGHAVGRALGAHGIEAIACLANRSARTRRLAAEGGVRDCPTPAETLERADLVLSIVPPGMAVRAADETAEAMAASGFRPPYADCNAVSPETARAIGRRISEAGADFIDGAILGPPPRAGRSATRLYFSGERAGPLSELEGEGIVVRLLGEEIGRASGLKMCYAALTKGTHALQTAVMTLAESLGLGEEASREFRESQEASWGQMASSAPRLPVVAWRYVDEMRQIAGTFESAGVTPMFHRGAAQVYSHLAATPLAEGAPETMDGSLSPRRAAAVYAESLPMKAEEG